MQLETNLNEVLIEIQEDLVNHLGASGVNNLLNDISSGLLRTMQRRIHSDGLDRNLASIGKYSSDPAYFNPKTGAVRVSLPNKGKTGKTQFNNGKPHKTRYYSNGYKGWRQANRRKTDKVNLVFKGDLRRSFTYVKTQNFYSIGFRDSENYQKAKGLEKHFNSNIWGLGQRENKVIDETIEMYLKKM